MNCLNCNKETHNPKFCSRSCAATVNNKGVRRHGKDQGRAYRRQKYKDGKSY